MSTEKNLKVEEGEFIVHNDLSPTKYKGDFPFFIHNVPGRSLRIVTAFQGDSTPLGAKFEDLDIWIHLNEDPLGTYQIPGDGSSLLRYRRDGDTVTGVGSLTLTQLDDERKQCIGTLTFDVFSNKLHGDFNIFGASGPLTKLS